MVIYTIVGDFGKSKCEKLSRDFDMRKKPRKPKLVFAHWWFYGGLVAVWFWVLAEIVMCTGPA